MNELIPLRTHIEEVRIEDLKEYFKPEVFLKYCKACDFYQKIWTCPTHDFDMLNRIDDFKYAYIIGNQLYLNELGEALQLLSHKSLDYATNEIYKAARIQIDKKIKSIDKDDLLIFYAGRCMFCDCCARQRNLSCVYPKEMRFSLESIGFDVASIAEEILGSKIQWAKDSLPSYFTFVSAIFSREKIKLTSIYSHF